MHQDKRRVRKLKRDIKRAGAKHRRRELKQSLRDQPDMAHHAEENLGGHRSQTFNGLDKDATRQR